MRPSGLRGVWGKGLPVVAAGLGVTLLFWHADSMRLHPEGESLAWVAVVAVGVGWMSRGRAGLLSGAGGLLAGSTAALFGTYGGLQLLPLTPLGTGIALGTSAAALAALAVGLRRVVPAGPAAAAFGVGAGAARFVGLGATSGVDDVLAAWTAVAFSLLLGVVLVELVEYLRAWRKSGERVVLPIRGPAELPSPEGAEFVVDDEVATEVLSLDDDVYGPLLEPREHTGTSRRRRS